MSLRGIWPAWPWDVRLGYAAVAFFVLRTALDAGPADLLLMLSGCLAVLLLAVISLVVAIRLIIGPRRRARALPFVLAAGCVAATVAVPSSAADLHLIIRVYMAGGPGHINDWGQALIREQHGNSKSRFVDYDQVPTDVRDYLPGRVSVGGTICSDMPRVRIERGGGFYHYGVVVYPSGSIPQAEWWQKALDWPPEVVIYHEE